MKFHEVTLQIVLTDHLIAHNLSAIGLKKWPSLTPAQQKTLQSAADHFDEAVIAMALKNAAALVSFFKAPGPRDPQARRGSFCKHVLEVYAKSKFAEDWPAGMLEQINAL